MSDNIKVQKHDIRKKICSVRASLSATDKQQKSLAICKKIQTIDAWKHAKNIALYFATKNEVQTDQLINACWQQQKTAFLPVIQHKKMAFYQYEKNTVLINNRFNIAEPDTKHSHFTETDKLDLIILPLIAFDSNKNRLGQGGGFYDRTFAELLEKKPTLIGIAYDCQRVASVPTEKWDIPLDYVVSESDLVK